MAPSLRKQTLLQPLQHSQTEAHQKQFSAAQQNKLDIMSEESSNNNNNEHEVSRYASQRQHTGASRSSSALSTSGSEELDPRDDRPRATYLSSGSTSGAEDSSPSPELGQLQLEDTIEEEQREASLLPILHSNLIPETKHANRVVETIRVKFVENLPKQAQDIYEDCDLKALRQELPPPDRQELSLTFRWISRFLCSDQLQAGHELSDKDVAAVLEKLHELLETRHQYRVPRARADQFCKEIILLHGIFPFGYDKQHLPILYLRSCVHRRWSRKLDEAFRRYVTWQIDLMTKSSAGARVNKTVGRLGICKDGSFGICFDCNNLSYSCVDMDFLRFLVHLLVHCYPTYCLYALCLDLPWLFRSVWKLVRSWLPEEARQTVLLITSKQLTDYIDEDQIPNCIKIKENYKETVSEKRKHRLPDNFESIQNFDEFAKQLQLPQGEVKSFMAHAEKVIQEYKQLGAI